MNTEDRLRRALADVGLPAPEGAGLHELAVRAARIIHDHAEHIRDHGRRIRERALPTTDVGDPWRVGAQVQEYTLTAGLTGRTFTVHTREVATDGKTERSTFGHHGPRGTRKRGADVMQIGPASDGRYGVPAHFTPDEARAAVPTPKYTGTRKVFMIREVRGVAYNHSPSAYICARSWTEVAHLCAQQGLRIDVKYHQAYSSSGNLGSAGADAARAQPGTLLVSTRELDGHANERFIPYVEYAPRLESARLAAANTQTSRR